MFKIQEKQKKAKCKRREVMGHTNRIKAVFITFSETENRNIVLKKLRANPFTACCLSITSKINTSDIRNFDGNILRSKIAPEPENITWENVQLTDGERRIRKLCVFFIQIALFAFPIIAVVLLSSSLTTKSDDAKIECPLVTQKATAITDYNLGVNALG
jgi:hypothetical protein